MVLMLRGISYDVVDFGISMELEWLPAYGIRKRHRNKHTSLFLEIALCAWDSLDVRIVCEDTRSTFALSL